MELPKVFEDFCHCNGIEPSIYDQEQGQYFYTQVEEEELQSDAVGINGKAVSCRMIPNFYKICADKFQFSTSKLYEEGRLLPMDLSSGLAVSLLDLNPSDHVLDLCCAPGGKLILASFLQGCSTDFSKPEQIGTLTGVDIAEHRLATCRSMIKKYKVRCARLFCADGTKFSEPVRQFINPSENEKITTEPNRRVPFHETTAFRKRRTTTSSALEYDKVLIDAQCTHDGSIKHIRKHQQNDWKGFDLTQFEPENLAKLHNLQFDLLENGFKMLKPGGILIYSTCSLTRGQNEDIIERLLKKWGSLVIPFPFEGSNELGQLRMSPPDFDSGFFICRIKKGENK